MSNQQLQNVYLQKKQLSVHKFLSIEHTFVFMYNYVCLSVVSVGKMAGIFVYKSKCYLKGKG